MFWTNALTLLFVVYGFITAYQGVWWLAALNALAVVLCIVTYNVKKMPDTSPWFTKVLVAWLVLSIFIYIN